MFLCMQGLLVIGPVSYGLLKTSTFYDQLLNLRLWSFQPIWKYFTATLENKVIPKILETSKNDCNESCCPNLILLKESHLKQNLHFENISLIFKTKSRNSSAQLTFYYLYIENNVFLNSFLTDHSYDSTRSDCPVPLSMGWGPGISAKSHRFLSI